MKQDIIAPLKGNEFYRACNNIGVEFIQISPASLNCINIMEIRKTDTTVADLLDAPNIDKSMLAGKIQKLHIFFSLLIPDMTYEEKQLLDDALIKTYALKGITHNNDSLVDTERPDRYKEMPILGDHMKSSNIPPKRSVSPISSTASSAVQPAVSISRPTCGLITNISSSTFPS